MIMRLYATVKSDRAEKAQGGNEFIRLTLQRERDRIEYDIEYTLDGIRLSARTDSGGVVLYDGMRKGKRRKGEAVRGECDYCGGAHYNEDHPRD